MIRSERGRRSRGKRILSYFKNSSDFRILEGVSCNFSYYYDICYTHTDIFLLVYSKIDGRIWQYWIISHLAWIARDFHSPQKSFKELLLYSLRFTIIRHLCFMNVRERGGCRMSAKCVILLIWKFCKFSLNWDNYIAFCLHE